MQRIRSSQWLSWSRRRKCIGYQLREKTAALNKKKQARDKTLHELNFHKIMKHISPAEMFRTALKIKDSEIDNLQKEIDELNATL